MDLIFEYRQTSPTLSSPLDKFSTPIFPNSEFNKPPRLNARKFPSIYPPPQVARDAIYERPLRGHSLISPSVVIRLLRATLSGLHAHLLPPELLGHLRIGFLAHAVLVTPPRVATHDSICDPTKTCDYLLMELVHG